MRHYQNKSTAALVFSLGILLVTLGCTQSKTIVVEKPPPQYSPPAKNGPPPWAPAHGYRAKHRYYYYPSTFVYFDVERKLYFYLEGDSWRAGASLPARISPNPGDHVSLEMDTDKPYEFHADVAKKYPPGQLKNKEKGKDKKKAKKEKGKDK